MIKPSYHDNLTTLYCGDCKEIMKQLPNDMVSLINTDPPYTDKLLDKAYTILAEESCRVMRHGASLTMLTGHFAIDRVIIMMVNSGLKYNWIVKMDQPAVHVRMRLGIEVTWMPILWYGKSNRFLSSWMKDGFTVEGRDGIEKPYHKWQKDLSWAEFFIRNLTRENEIILDPFMGSGTTIMAARKLNRISIGIDIEQECVDIAIKRIVEE